MVRVGHANGMSSPLGTSSRPWTWVPSLYLVQGIPYAVVTAVSVVFFKNMGLSNAEVALYTSWLNLPWVIKPLWSPLVELLGTRRHWVLIMQLVLGGGMAALALTLPLGLFPMVTLVLLWLLAFASATHDIAADGFYMLGLAEDQQAFFSGIRSLFFRLAMLLGQGGVVMLAGVLELWLDTVVLAWMLTFGALGLLLLTVGVYHLFRLPRPAADIRVPWRGWRIVGRESLATYRTFFTKPAILSFLGFLLFYRFAEAQLIRLASPFLLDPVEVGGLAMTTVEVGFVYGTVGVGALILGGVTGGFMIARYGLGKMLWPMVCAINLPNALYLILALLQPQQMAVVLLCVALEQLGYGFGFSAYMLVMIYIARGVTRTAHYALCTGFMALGMMIPGMWSGSLQESLGYPLFFGWIMLCTVPGFLVVAWVKIDPDFGTRQDVK